jgi:hypothetical protein
MPNHFKVPRKVIIGVFTTFIAGLLLLAAWYVPKVYSAGPSARATQEKIGQELARHFRRYEQVQLDPVSVVQQLRRTGRLSVKSATQDFEVDLVVNDLRAPNYRAEDVGVDGVVHQLPLEPPQTYKGHIVGQPASQARFTIDGAAIEGTVLAEGEIYFVESQRKYDSAAAASDFILYKASDVIMPERQIDAALTLPEKIAYRAERLDFNAAAPDVFTPFKVAEIATEADFEYVSALGSATAANNDILSILNQVQGIYEQQIGLSFTVVFQHTWSTSADPYSVTNDPLGMLNEFTNYWQANFLTSPTPARDLAHLFTGRSLGGPSGIAWQGALRSSASAFRPMKSVTISGPRTRMTRPRRRLDATTRS